MKTVLIGLLTVGALSCYAQDTATPAVPAPAVPITTVPTADVPAPPVLTTTVPTAAVPAPAVPASGTLVTVPPKAVLKLEKLLKSTQTAMAVGRRQSALPPEARPIVNRILVQSATDFLAITNGQPTKEAYYQSVESGLARILPLVPKLEDRQQVAEYYQDLLDIVGLETSEGRLMAFVDATPPAKL